MLDIVSPTLSASHRLGVTTEIVAAYVSHNSVPVGELTTLIRDIHQALVSVEVSPMVVPEPGPLKPAVPIKKSIHDEFIVCLENGKRYKALKRHLFTAYGLTPDQYREKWRLPKDYPMVAPAYSQSRSNLARQTGLGRKPGDAHSDASKSEPMVVPPTETDIGHSRSAKRRKTTAA